MADKQQETVNDVKPQTKKRRHLPRWIVIAGSVVLGIVVFSVGLYAFYSLSYRQRIFPNVAIGSVKVGGMSRVEAKALLADAVGRLESEELPIQVIGGDQLQFTTEKVNAQYAIDASVNAAFDVGRSASLARNIINQVQLVLLSNTVEPVLTYQSEELDSFLDAVSIKFDVPEQNAGFTYENSNFVVVPAKDGKRYNRALLKDHLTNSLNSIMYPDKLVITLDPIASTVQEQQVRILKPTIENILNTPITLVREGYSQVVTTEQIATWLTITPVPVNIASTDSLARLDFSKSAIQAYISTIAANFVQEPKDAKFVIEGGKAKVFQQSQDGIALDEAGSIDNILALLERRRTLDSSNTNQQANDKVELAVKTTKPAVSSDTISNLGIQELIGRGETDFSGSPSNRIHNITTGMKYINGWLIKPGETFSTVKALGAVDASTGYLPELVIKENKTIPEYGGGLCQVSTTLFRSVLNAGLKVTERRNHSYRVSYYERGVGPGLDATVYLPKPDFAFLNDTPGWILIQGEIKGNSLSFELYGTKDGRTSTIDGPHTLSQTAPPPSIYETTDKLAPGETKMTEHPHEGAHTIATYSVMKDGKELYHQVFESFYKALPAHYLKGADAAAPAATDTPPPADTQTQDSPSADAPAA